MAATSVLRVIAIAMLLAAPCAAQELPTLKGNALQKQQREAAVANLELRKSQLEEAKKMGPERLDEIHRLAGIANPKADASLRKYREAREALAKLKKDAASAVSAEVERLENMRDESATLVFESFESALRDLQRKVKEVERDLMIADGIWVVPPDLKLEKK